MNTTEKTCVYGRAPVTQAHRFFEHPVEHRCEVAGRRVDDLEDLGNGALTRQRFVVRSCLPVEPLLQLDNLASEFGVILV